MKNRVIGDKGWSTCKISLKKLVELAEVGCACGENSWQRVKMSAMG